jgi:hypothetical protein
LILCFLLFRLQITEFSINCCCTGHSLSIVLVSASHASSFSSISTLSVCSVDTSLCR